MQINKTPPFVEFKDVNFSRNNTTILENINLKIYKGNYVGVFGPNGGGKTTLIQLLIGSLKPDSGEIDILTTQKKSIAYVSQKVATATVDFPATVYEVLTCGQKLDSVNTKQNQTKVFEVLEMLQIQNLQHRLLKNLSGGERQKVFIARSLVDSPELLILDEPTVGIDLQSQNEFYSFLQKLNKELKITIILVSHDIGVVSHEVDRVFFLNRNISCYHSPEEFLKPDNLRLLYGNKVNIITHNHTHV